MLGLNCSRAIRHSTVLFGHNVVRKELVALQANVHSGSNPGDELKKLSKKAKGIEFRVQKNRKNIAVDKILKKMKFSNKKSEYEVHDMMSIRDLSRLTGADEDTLLDIAFTHVREIDFYFSAVLTTFISG